jgi:hypothetical protein
MLQIRAINIGLTIDRSTFFQVGDPNILHLNDTMTRVVNRDEFNRYINYTNEGFASIKNLVYDIREPNGFINVLKFKSDVDNNPSRNEIHDLRKGNRPFNVNPIQNRGGLILKGRGSSMNMRLNR